MDDKIYFQPGDLVRLNKRLPNAPDVMIVVKKETSIFKHKEENEGSLRGIRCRWFNAAQELQEAVFNTKDITLIQ